MRKCVRCNTEMNEELEIKVDMQSYGISVRAVFESGSLRGKMEKGFCKVTNMMVEEMNHNAFVHN